MLELESQETFYLFQVIDDLFGKIKTKKMKKVKLKLFINYEINSKQKKNERDKNIRIGNGSEHEICLIDLNVIYSIIFPIELTL